MAVRITKTEKEKIFHETEKMFRVPKTKTGRFLCSLAESVDALFTQGSHQAIPLSSLVEIRRGKKFREEYQKKMRTLQSLKQQKLVDIEKKGQDLFISLTDKGWSKFVSDKRYKTSAKLSDGQACFVSFDIPEDLRDIRRVVRAELKRAEFKLVHHSLWKSEYDVSAELAKAIREAGAGHWVKIFIGNEIGTS